MPECGQADDSKDKINPVCFLQLADGSQVPVYPDTFLHRMLKYQSQKKEGGEDAQTRRQCDN